LAARRRIERQNRSAVLGLCAAIVAELRAGRQPSEALDRAGIAWSSGAPRALSAARAGEEVVDALKLDAKQPGRGGLRALAVCWQVAEHHGTGLATAVGQITASLRTDEEHRRRLAAELAGPRATARLLALLPLAGIAMGQALDADPLQALVTTSWGRLALAVGIALEVCGTWWVSHIAKEVERSL
jgi:tight adherence protein B